MEQRLSMLETSDLAAECLSEVVSQEMDDGGGSGMTFDCSGNLVAVKVQKRIPLPENPEQLRLRVKLWEG